MESFIWKPSTVYSWKKQPVLLVPSETEGVPTITTPDGQTYTGKFINNNEGRKQYGFPAELVNMENLKVSYGGQDFTIATGSTSYEGSSLSSMSARAKGSLGEGGTTGIGGEFAPGTVGEFGVAPAYIGDQFPEAVTTTYDPIEGGAPSYQYIDPIKFGNEFNTYQRGQLRENFGQGGQFALDAIDTEFQGLMNFVPRSAQLKRDTVAADNTFNQAERTRQIEGAIPGVLADLDQQAADARIYARGDVPNEVINRGLEIGTRSGAADAAATGGFGIASSAARKVSDLMSAEKRIALSFQGNQMLSGVNQQIAGLRLAPTQFSDAGAQVRSTPSLSGSQLQQQNYQEANQQVNIPGTTAFQSSLQQSQFLTNLIQRTQEFNASNTLQNDQFNATNLNEFALSFFSYLNSYVNSVAGAAQTNINTGVALDEQEKARAEASRQRKKTQKGNAITDTIDAVTGGAGAILGFGGWSDTRLKEDMVPLTAALDTLKNLKVFNYSYKEGTIAADGGKPHVGISAQQLQTILPQSVGTHESGYLQIDPSELIYLLIRAVQELAER